jgi:hypothetical protein|tara:strand:+ start:154 stop:858 length:705 start_codon:yes stop_codon:yes gene_type:complete
VNSKIAEQLNVMFRASPQLMRDDALLKQAINGTFGVDIKNVYFISIAELTNLIDYAVLEKYFSKVWQPQTKKYKYSGLSIIDEINKLNPKRVLDLGCGYNEFKGKISNLIGVDPYNSKADIQSSILDYRSKELFDITICLGSINFGSVDKVYDELEHAINLTAPGGLLYFRANPGKQHSAPEAKWIDFFNWTTEFIINSASQQNCSILDLRQEDGERGSRYYFVLRKQSTHIDK